MTSSSNPLPALPLLIIMTLSIYSLLFLLLFTFHDETSTSNVIDDESLIDGIFKRSDQHNTTKKPIYFQISLDRNNQHKMFWTLDYTTQTATIEIKATLNRRTDWFAIGFSDYGNITKADLCVLWADSTGKVHFDDTNTDEESFLSLDDQNDCTFLKLSRKGDTIRLVFQRKFDTCDPVDYVIEDGTTHVVYATGSGPLKRLDNLRLLSNHIEHGFVRTRFLKVLEEEVLPPPEGTKQVKIVNNATHVPPVETTYWCSVHQLPPELRGKKHHVIQYEAVIQAGHESLVHHMEVFHCEVPEREELPIYDGPCTSPSKPPIIEACKRVIAAWAMGAQAMVYPREAGLPIGGEHYSRYVMLEMHYNNPELKSWIDSSGLKLIYTDKLRENDVGVLEIGLEYTDKNSIPPRQPGFQLLGFCVSECTRIGLPLRGITAIASQLHTHLTGARVWTKHVRGGRELPEFNRDNHYSQHFQEIRRLRTPVTVLPGDSLINICEYNTMSRKNITLGGFAISEEMCVNYIHYYPKTDLEVCKSSVDTRVLRRYFNYMHDSEGEDTSSSRGISDNYHSIHWSRRKASQLKLLYDQGPLSMQCNRSSGERFPGDWEGVEVTKIVEPLPEKESRCKGRMRG